MIYRVVFVRFYDIKYYSSILAIGMENCRLLGNCTTEFACFWTPPKIKVQLFWEGHKNLRHSPIWFWHLLSNVKTIRRMAQIFVAFSEKLNFSIALSKPNFTEYSIVACSFFCPAINELLITCFHEKKNSEIQISTNVGPIKSVSLFFYLNDHLYYNVSCGSVHPFVCTSVSSLYKAKPLNPYQI